MDERKTRFPIRDIGSVGTALSRQVSGASLGAVRIIFGAVMFYEALWFLGVTPNASNGVSAMEYWYTGEHVRWTFSLFSVEILQPLPASLMKGLFVVLAVGSALVSLGLAYRCAIVAVAATFTYVVLLESSFYQNHFYLACLIAWMLVFLPANRRLSIDRLIHKRWRGENLPRHVPFWSVFLLRAQLFLVYFYAGLAKVNPDWLVGEPLRMWLRQKEMASFLNGWVQPETLTALRAGLASETCIWLLSYGGLLFDLGIGFLLIGRRTRLLGFALVMLFHGSNFFIFQIGAFPVMAVGLTTVFLDVDWPIRVWLWLRRPRLSRPDVAWSVGGALVVPVIGVLLGWKAARPDRVSNQRSIGWATATLVVVWIGWQTLIPLRHFAIPGNVSWTEEGHRFSWHMMLRAKQPGPFQMEVDVHADSSLASDDDWLASSDQHVRQYRQMHSDAAHWAQLPELVLTYEPLLGERIIFNPFAGDNWTTAAASARRKWLRQYGVAPDFRRTWPLNDALRQLHRVVASSDHDRALSMLNDVELALQLNQRIQQDSPSDADQHRYALELQEVLHRIAARRTWRKTVLALFMQTTPFALQGHAEQTAPFMVIISPELIQRERHSAVSINREYWHGDSNVLVDLTRLAPLHMRSMPRVVEVEDFDGRKTRIWNYAVDLHKGQYDLLRNCPRAQCQYARRVARLWRDRYGTSPQVHVTSYVRLNHHPLKQIVDPTVNLAGVRWQHWTHNSWILPFADDAQRTVYTTAAVTSAPR